MRVPHAAVRILLYPISPRCQGGPELGTSQVVLEPGHLLDELARPARPRPSAFSLCVMRRAAARSSFGLFIIVGIVAAQARWRILPNLGAVDVSASLVVLPQVLTAIGIDVGKGVLFEIKAVDPSTASRGGAAPSLVLSMPLSSRSASLHG